MGDAAWHDPRGPAACECGVTVWDRRQSAAYGIPSGLWASRRRRDGAARTSFMFVPADGNATRSPFYYWNQSENGQKDAVYLA